MAKRKQVPKSERHILAMGGGATSPAMIHYALSLSGKKSPKLLFINTATGDRPDVKKFCDEKVSTLGCTTKHLQLFARTPVDLESLIFSQDSLWLAPAPAASAGSRDAAPIPGKIASRPCRRWAFSKEAAARITTAKLGVRRPTEA
jgi:hypothetical protein